MDVNSSETISGWLNSHSRKKREPMPYKDRDKQREYAKIWIAQRRANFFVDKVCAHCGTKKDLELDHIDPNHKVSHRIWSWNEKRRLIEIAKCQVLCRPCHQDKARENKESKGQPSGQAHPAAKLTYQQILSAKILYSQGVTLTELALRFGVHRTTIGRAIRGSSYPNADEMLR